MNAYEAARALAGTQHGLITVQQAAKLGIPEPTLRKLAATRAWELTQPGVIALPGAPPTPERAIQAAVLSVGGLVLPSHWSAAWTLGLVSSAPTIVDLTVPFRRGAPKLHGVRGHRSRHLCAGDGVRARGLQVTSAARTLCDLAAVTAPHFLRSLVIDARQRKLASLEEMDDVRLQLGRRAGLSKLGRILHELDREICDSMLELASRRALAARGVPEPYPRPYPVRVGNRTLHLDIAWPRAYVAVECLGLASHSERAQLDRDALRSNLLATTPWRIFLVTWTRIETDADGFATEIRTALWQATKRA